MTLFLLIEKLGGKQTFQQRAQLITQCDAVLVAETSLPTAGTEEVSYFEWDCTYL